MRLGELDDMRGTPSDAVLLEEPSPGVRLITLNKPELHNAMTPEVSAAWAAAIESIADDPEVRALVVTGAGRSFCSGADLSWLLLDEAQSVTVASYTSRMEPFYNQWLVPRRLPFPVIAAVNGPAVGAGVCTALACDLRYAGPAATFSTPFIYLGMHGGMAAGWLLQEAVGVTRAREMLYTGRELTADEAQSWGMVSEVVEDSLAYSLEMAARIASAAPIATRLTKKGLEQSAHGLSASLEWEALAQSSTFVSKDLREGIAARLERRSPVFRGH